MSTKQCGDFGDRYTLVLGDSDLDAICNYLGGDYADDREDITGAMVIELDGDYEEVWLTSYSAPYELGSIYDQARYWWN